MEGGWNSDEEEGFLDDLDNQGEESPLTYPPLDTPAPFQSTSPLRSGPLTSPQRTASPARHGSPKRYPPSPHHSGGLLGGSQDENVPAGRKFQQAPGYGDCLFYATIMQLQQPITAQQLRLQCCEQLAAMRNDLENYVDVSVTPFDVQLNELRQPGVFDRDLFDHMPDALSRVLRQKIVIVQPDGKWIVFGGEPLLQEQDICLMKAAHAHYDAALVRGRQYPNLSAVIREANQREANLFKTYQVETTRHQQPLTSVGAAVTTTPTTAPTTSSAPHAVSGPAGTSATPPAVTSSSTFWTNQLNFKSDVEPITDPVKLEERYNAIMAEIREQGESAIDQLARHGLDVDFVHPDAESFFAAVGKQLDRVGLQVLDSNKLRLDIQGWVEAASTQLGHLNGFQTLKANSRTPGQWSNDWEAIFVRIFFANGYSLLVFSDFKPVVRYDSAVNVNPTTQIIIYRTRHYSYHSTRILPPQEAETLRQQLDPAATALYGGYGSVEEQLMPYSRFIIPEPVDFIEGVCRQLTNMITTVLTNNIIVEGRKSPHKYASKVPQGLKITDIMDALEAKQKFEFKWEEAVMEILQKLYAGRINLLRECAAPTCNCPTNNCPVVVVRKAQYYYATSRFPAPGGSDGSGGSGGSGGGGGGGGGGGQRPVTPSSQPSRSVVTTRPKESGAKRRSDKRQTETGLQQPDIVQDPTFVTAKATYNELKRQKLKQQQQPGTGQPPVAPQPPAALDELFYPPQPTPDQLYYPPTQPGQDQLCDPPTQPGQDQLYPTQPQPGQDQLYPTQPQPGQDQLYPTQTQPRQDQLYPTQPQPGQGQRYPTQTQPGQGQRYPSQPQPGQGQHYLPQPQPGQNQQYSYPSQPGALQQQSVPLDLQLPNGQIHRFFLSPDSYQNYLNTTPAQQQLFCNQLIQSLSQQRM